MNRDVQMMVEGSLLERLLQQALRCGACFARVRRQGARRMIVTADPTSAAILMQLCKTYGLNARELSRGGFTAAKQVLRRRWTLLPGMLLCLMICSVLLGRVWMVDVRLSEGGSRNEILRCLQENGVHIGMASRKIDTDLLGKQLIAAAGDYSHIGVRIQGIRLLVEASAELPAPETYAIGKHRNLVAARSGVIHEIEVYSGEACVKPGDTVLAGDVLVRGREVVGKNSDTGEEITVPVGALGKVTARCWFEGHAEGFLDQIEYRRTGETRSECRLHLGQFSLPISECAAYASEECEAEILPLVGLFLPLEIRRTTHHETRAETLTAKPEALQQRLQLLACADALRRLHAADIEYTPASDWTDAQINGNTLQIRAVYEIYTDIAVASDAQAEEVY